MIKVAITGSTGLVGSRIVELLSSEFDFIPLSHDRVDITDEKSVKIALADIDYDVLLHLAGYTNVDKAEIEKNEARLLNVDATKFLLEATKRRQKKFIYISTDFVFDGDNPPYSENSSPNPISYYGQTKYEGEKVVGDSAMIVRISYPFRASYEKRSDFFRTIKTLLGSGKQVSGITDAVFTPTCIDDIALGLSHLLNNYSPEIYHLVGAESLSPYEAFMTIAKIFELNSSLVTKITYDDFFLNKAKRPRQGKTISLKNSFHKMKSFSEALIEFKAAIK